MKKIIKNKKGFTYIETIIAILLMSIIFVPIVDSLYYSLVELVSSIDCKNGSYLAENNIENIKNNSKMLIPEFKQLTSSVSIDTSVFYDTYIVNVYKKDANGDTTDYVVCRYVYFYK